MIVLFLIMSMIIVISMVKWFSYFYGLGALIHYMELNNMRLPTDEETKEATKWAIESSINSMLRKRQKR